jgi:hypothetical protein
MCVVGSAKVGLIVVKVAGLDEAGTAMMLRSMMGLVE